jgi:MerR family transcriptional regulator, copper efflux regulator
MRIGELAKRLGVATSKIRFLEARGLIQSARLPSGYRDYDDGALQMLQIILQAQSFGFTLEEINRSLAELGSQGPSCDYLIDRLMAKLQELDHHIEQTVALRQRLLDMVEELKMRRTSGEPNLEEKKPTPPKVGARLLRAS